MRGWREEEFQTETLIQINHDLIQIITDFVYMIGIKSLIILKGPLCTKRSS